MSELKRPFWSTLPARILATVVVLGVIFVLLIPAPNGGGPIVPPPPPLVKATARCNRELENILDGLAPGRLGINSDAPNMAIQLNRWFSNCGEDLTEQLKLNMEAPEKLLADEDFQSLGKDRFTPQDAEHYRSATLLKVIAENVCNGIQSDADRVHALFDFVVMNTMLLTPETSAYDDLPSTPYEILLWGEGTAEDRAWLFAELLRQVRIDAFILLPNSKQEQWLVAVHTGEFGTQLYDLRIGLPIPAVNDDALAPVPTSAARLENSQELETSFRKLDVDEQAYPLSGSDLKSFELKLIGNLSLWSQRLAELQFMAPPGGAILFDGLGSNELQPGSSQLERAIAAGKEQSLWTADQIGIWDYSLEQTRLAATVARDSDSLFDLKMKIFAGPQLVVVSDSTDDSAPQVMARSAKRTLHAVRVEQLTGQYKEALLNYGPVFNSYRTNPNPMNEEAANYAALWIGSTQAGSQRSRQAISTFDRFLNTPRQSATGIVPIAEMRLSASRWKARISMLNGDIHEAIQSLEFIPASERSHSDMYFLRRWGQLNIPTEPVERND